MKHIYGKRGPALWERVQLCTRKLFNGSLVSFLSSLKLRLPFMICFSCSVNACFVAGNLPYFNDKMDFNKKTSIHTRLITLICRL